jgi:NADH-quinone oxidoreductase subunit J
MIPDIILFILLALVAVLSALGLLLSKNAVYSALNLILNFSAVAVLYLILGAPFIALAQITVYAGAIMVLFLFVIMLLGAERLPSAATLPWQRPLAISSAVLLAVLAIYVIFIRPVTFPGAAPLTPKFGSPFEVGTLLFDKYLLPFEIISVLLLVAMIGVIVLTRRRDRKNRG